MPSSRYARIEPPSSAVVAVEDGRVLYVGPSLSAAAFMLVPGTVSGVGETDLESVREATDAARRIQESRRLG